MFSFDPKDFRRKKTAQVLAFQQKAAESKAGDALTVGNDPLRVEYTAADIRNFIRAYEDFRRTGKAPEASPNVRFGDEGLHLEKIVIIDRLVLASLRLPMRLCFWRCEFLQAIDVRWMEIDELSFEACTFHRAFHGQSLRVAGHLDFSGLTAHHAIDISVGKVGGDIKFRGACLRYNSTDKETAHHHRESPRWGAPLFAGGVAAHSVLLEGMECFGRVFMDAAKLTGILMATDAKLHSHYAVEKRTGVPPSLWDHLALSATDAVIEGAVVLGKESRGSELDSAKAYFSAFGQVSFANGILNGDLICSGARLQSAFVHSDAQVVAEIDRLDDVRLAALHFSRALVEGSAFLDSNFVAYGEVRFNGADVRGTLGCDRGTFDGRIPHIEGADSGPVPVLAKALSLRRANVGSDLNLNRGFSSYGDVNLRNVTIGGELDCIGGEFRGWRSQTNKYERRQPESLGLSGAEVKGHVLLCAKIPSGPASAMSRFKSFGEVRFRGARVHGNFHLDGGLFDRCHQDAITTSSSGNSYWRWLFGRFHAKATQQDVQTVARFESLTVDGTTFLSNSETREFNARNKTTSDAVPDSAKFVGSVTFEGMRTDVWEDSEDCWPQCDDALPPGASIELNGLTYQRLRGPLSGTKRLAWLLQQPEHDLAREEHAVRKVGEDSARLGQEDRRDWGFKTQPWEHCAAVLYAMGYRRDARYLYRMQQRFLRLHGRLRIWERVYNGLIGMLVGHGYRPYHALQWAIMLLFLGWMVFEFGYRHGQITATETRNDAGTVEEVAPFNALLYSADVALPVVELGERDRWKMANKSPQTADADERYVLTLGSLGKPITNYARKWGDGADIAILCLLFIFVASSAFLPVWNWPNFAGQPGRDYRDKWNAVFVRASRLNKRHLGRIIAPIGGPAITSYALTVLFVWVLLVWLLDSGWTDALLKVADSYCRALFQITLVRAWFAFQTTVGWLLVSALFIGIGGTVFRPNR
jgi:hypothetical protein